ncbi:MAG: hypothetical protein ABIY55_26455 [Kofleriaceae bacterium]
MSKITSKIMKLFLPEVSAGACSADAGCCCNKPGKHKRAITCLGTCVLASGCHTIGCFT